MPVWYGTQDREMQAKMRGRLLLCHCHNYGGGVRTSCRLGGDSLLSSLLGHFCGLAPKKPKFRPAHTTLLSPFFAVLLQFLEHGVEAVVDLRDLELLELDRGRVEREPHGERELGVHQEGRLHGKGRAALLPFFMVHSTRLPSYSSQLCDFRVRTCSWISRA